MATERDLRRASDDLLARLDELDALEQVKRDQQPGTEGFVALAERIEALARELLQTSELQASIARAAAEQRASGDPGSPVRPIAEVEPRDPTTVLAEWRELERRLAADDPTLDTAAGRQQADALRDEYRTAFERRTRGNLD
jgi:hypothetical protein